MNGLKRVTPLHDQEGPHHKKQRVDSTTLSETDSDDRDVGLLDHNLENFRKEAIWREMQDYRRKFERASSTIESLERDRKRCEARLSAVDFTWNLLVKEAELLLPSTSSAPNGHSHHSATSSAVSDLSLTDEELEEALQHRSADTKALLCRLEGLHPSDSAAGHEGKLDELQDQCRTILEQSLRSQEALRLLRTTHEATVLQLETVSEDLARAEKKLDRLQSRTVAIVEGRTLPDVSSSSNSVEGGSRGDVKPHLNGGTPRAGLSPLTGGTSGGGRSEVEEYRALAESRAKDLDELRNERVTLRLDLDTLRAKLTSLPDDIIAESAPFKLLQSHVHQLTVEYESRRIELDKTMKEAEGLRESQESFRNTIMREAEDQIEEIQQRLLAKESDLTRIRAQREEFRADATELRAKESEKIRNSDQLRTLAESRAERIATYSSEVRRLKMQIAANRGDVSTVDLLAQNEEEGIVKDLQARLKTAEDLLLALRDQLRSYSSIRGTFDSQTLAKSETDARLELSNCREKLDKLEALLGPEGNAQVKDLVKKLEARDERLKVLEAQVKSQDHAMNMLYGEIDRLSTAWSTLDEQNSAKVFNLVHLEEKVQRLNTDKAKADNRYFATMRQKDAIAAENTVLTKLAEKQQRAVDGVNDLQHSLNTQLIAAEKEISAHQRNVRAYQDSLAIVKRENAELSMRNDQNSKHIAELNAVLAERIQQAESELAARKRVEEQISRAEREIKAARLQSAANAGESSQVRELQKYNDDLSAMLKCSTCSIRFKAVINNRCGHLFCKECIDARLSNRQRKCPTCGIAFGKDDVSPVYF